MIIFAELKKVVAALEPFRGHWCICGGIAASIYGKEGRFTNDIDIAITDASSASAEEIATRVLKNLGYESILGFVKDPTGRTESQVKALVACRVSGSDAFVGIDFLLPIFPWLPDAVRRAQAANIDYGFAVLPTIQPEDLIIAKLFALMNSPERGVDLMDIRSILASGKKIDTEYLKRRILEFGLALPGDVEKILFS